jgi:hypothetical protein
MGVFGNFIVCPRTARPPVDISDSPEAVRKFQKMTEVENRMRRGS